MRPRPVPRPLAAALVLAALGLGSNLHHALGHSADPSGVPLCLAGAALTVAAAGRGRAVR